MTRARTMSEHATEPWWRVADDTGHMETNLLREKFPEAHTICAEAPPFAFGRVIGMFFERADAERAIAAINALEGIPTEFLETLHSDDIRAALGEKLAAWHAAHFDMGV